MSGSREWGVPGEREPPCGDSAAKTASGYRVLNIPERDGSGSDDPMAKAIEAGRDSIFRLAPPKDRVLGCRIEKP